MTGSQSPGPNPASHQALTTNGSDTHARPPNEGEPEKSGSPSTINTNMDKNRLKKRKLSSAKHPGRKRSTAQRSTKRPRLTEPCDESDTSCDNYDVTSYKEIWKSECLLGVLRFPSPILVLEEWQDIKEFIDQHKLRLPAPGLLESRFRYALLSTQWWGDVGCQICYVETGQRKRNHELRTCLFTPYSVRAAAIFDWLESLDMPHTLYRTSSKYSFYKVTGLDYKESKYRGDAVRSSAWYVTKTALGGHCERKPIVGRVIAALAAYDDQFLGKFLTRIVFDYDGKDMLQEEPARAWFQQQRPLKRNWYPGLLLAFEYLVLAFYYRQNTRRRVDPLINYPLEPPEPLGYLQEF